MGRPDDGIAHNPSASDFTIGEASRRSDVARSTIRRWEAAGAIRPRRTWTGQRRFSEADVRHLRKLAGFR